MIDYIIIGVLLIIGLIIVLVLINYFINHAGSQANKNLKLEILTLKIPKSNNQSSTKDFVQNRLGQIENIFTALSGLKVERKLFSKREDIFSLEIVFLNGHINFYIATPFNHKDFFIQQLQAIYPRISIQKTSGYNIFQPYSNVKAGILHFTNDYSLPIKTYRYFEIDPLESIINSFNNLKEDEGAAIQYVFRSAAASWHDRGKNLAKLMYRGKTYQEALKKMGSSGFWGSLVKIIKFILSFFSTKSSNKEIEDYNKEPMSAMEQERAIAMEQKTAKSGFDVNIRVVVCTKDDARSNLVLKDILNSYNQYNIYEFGNSFKADFSDDVDSYVEHFIYRHIVPQRSMILNSEEMTSVIHLPLETSQTPNIAWLEDKGQS